MNSKITLIILVINGLFSTVATASALKVAAQDSAPKYYYDLPGRTIQGLGIEILHALEQQDPLLKFTRPSTFIPIKRILKLLENGGVDVFVGLAYSQKRTQIQRYIETPIYPVRRIVAVRQTDQVTLENFEDIKKLGREGIIASLFGSRSQSILESQQGLGVNKKAFTVIRGLEMLDKGSIRFFFYHDLGLKHLIKSQGFGGRLKLLPTNFGSYNHYIAVSKKVPDAIFNKIERAMKMLQSSGKLQQIYQTY